MADVKGYNMPDDLYYHKDHAWARVDGTKVTVGMNDFFQKEAGDIVFIDLPDTEEEVVASLRDPVANGPENL
jgi:glycine cleavage system H protein